MNKRYEVVWFGSDDPSRENVCEDTYDTYDEAHEAAQGVLMLPGVEHAGLRVVAEDLQ